MRPRSDQAFRTNCRFSRFWSSVYDRGLQQFLERNLVQHLSAWVLGHCRGCARRYCHRSSTCPHNPISHPLKRIERYGTEKGLRPHGCRGLCPDYRKRHTVRSRPRIHQFQAPPEYLLRNPSLVPRPIGFGSPEFLPSLVQIVQRRQQSTKPATRRPPLVTRTCSSNYKLEHAMQKPQ